MITVPTSDTVYAQIKRFWPFVVGTLAVVSFGAHVYQWVHGGMVGPPPAPPVVTIEARPTEQAPWPHTVSGTGLTGATANNSWAADPALDQFIAANRAAAAGRRQHVLATRIAVRLELRKQGHTRADVLDALDLLDSDLGPKLLDQAVGDASKATGQTIEFPKPGAFGDGSIVQAILEWFKSPQGQAVIAALIKILLAALGL